MSSESKERPRHEILVAEDSATQAQQLAGLLEAHGYAVRIAQDGQAALAAIRSRKPTLVVSDVVMPKMDGYGLCRAIKDDPATHDVPVVLVTTLVDPGDLIRGLECGADNFIRKPYEARYLLARIDYLLMNLDLRKNQKMKVGIEINLGGERHFISAERQQILDLLISTFEQAVNLNQELATRERSLEHSNQVLHGLFRVTEGLNRALDEKGVGDAVLERAMEIPGVQAGWITLLQGKSDFRLLAARNLPPALAAPGALDGMCRCRRRLLSGELDSVTNMLDCERLENAREDTWGFKAHASVPIWMGDEVLGVLNLVGSDQGLFDEEDKESLYTVGNQLGVALGRARVHEGLERLVAERTASLAAEVEQRKLAQAEQARLVAILDATPDFVATATPEGRTLYLNSSARHLIGLGEGEDPSAVEISRTHPEWAGRKVLEEGIPQAIRRGSWSGETAYLRPDGTEIPVLEVILAHKRGDGTVDYLSTIARDISAIKAQEARILRLNRVYAVLSGINTTIVRVLDRQELFDESCRIAVELGGYLFAWIGLVDAEGERVRVVATAGRDDGYLEQIDLTTRPGAPDGCELTIDAITGGRPVVCDDIEVDGRMKRWSAQALHRGFRSAALFPLTVEGRGVGVFVLYSPEKGAFDEEEMRLLVEMAGDMSFAIDHIEKVARLDYLAYYDTVTGLPNRNLFRDRVGQRIAAARNRERPFSLILLDMERFSHVNDTLGREAGDDVLRHVARRLESVLGNSAACSRVGADCFGIALQHDDRVDGAARAVEAIVADFSHKPFELRGRELRMAARAGIATFPGDGEDPEALYRNAEAALRKAKDLGERYLFYTPEINARVAENLLMENKLRTAVERQQFSLQYQPKVNLASGRMGGVEALLRWNDPDAGPVSPALFVPFLESSGMILEAGRWVLERALEEADRWRGDDGRPLTVAVNVSAIQLRRDDFVPMVEEALARHKDARLELEITESVVMRDVQAVIAKLKALRGMGVDVAIDDFGTGYSSLSYIARLPVTSLKIDRAFIHSMASSPDDLSIVSSIISLAHSLKTRVVAEGVETEEQANFLRLLRCDEIQGYLVSRPVAPETIAQFVRGEASFDWKP
ncbi:MAG: EAL domain-containing protein [Burkholderiales bacterium]